MTRSSTAWLYYLLVCLNIQTILMTEISYVERLEGERDRFGFLKPNLKHCSSYDHAYPSGSINNECECSSGNSTFLYFQNTCVSNLEIQQDSGCQSNLLPFKNQWEDHLFVFDLNSVHVPGTDQSMFANIKHISDYCHVGQIKYLNDLSGTWITPSNAGSVFTIDRSEKQLTWNTMTVPQSFGGRVFKLETQNCIVTLQWGPPKNKTLTNPCIVFKAQGTLHFTVAPSPLPSIPGTSDSSTVLTSTPFATLNPPSSTVIPFEPGGISTAVRTIAPSASIGLLKPTEPSNNKGEKDKQSAPVGAIVGSVVAVVAVAIIIIIILVVIWRRRTQRQSEKPAKGPVDCNNPEYGNDVINLSKQKPQSSRSLDNELEYDYAAIDGDPRSHGNQPTNGTAPQVYQSLDPARDFVYTPLNREPGTPPDPTYAYNKIERPLYDPLRKGTADPLYNVLDRQNGNNHDYMEPGEHIDKGHNKRPTSKQDPQNNEPVYNVLEEPNQGGSKGTDEEDEPEYNVVEDPDNAYDYACVEGNIRHPPSCEDPDNGYDYARVEGNIRHPSSCDNVGYESTLGIKPPQSDPDYAVLEGPSSEPSYQPLQIKAQDDKVYQPLDRVSRNLEQPVYHVLEDKRNHSDA